MKIVMVFPGKIWGGAEQYVLDLGKALAARGNKVEFVANDRPAVRNRLATEDIDVVYTSVGGVYNLTGQRVLASRMKDADIVHIHEFKHVAWTVMARRLSGAHPRIVVTRHIARQSRTGLVTRLFMRSVNSVIFVSNLAMALWRRANTWWPSDRCYVVRNSIAPSSGNNTYAGISLREQYGISPDTPLLVFTGRVRRSKGCENIVKSLGNLSDRKFAMVFVGACKPKNYTERLRALADSLDIGDKVFFHGFSSDVGSLIAGSDIGLAPSVVREACPLSPQEFMQAGMCVIASDNGAQPEYITNGETGLLIDPHDIKALAAAIADMLEHPDRRRAIAAAGHTYFTEHMRYIDFVDSILSVYSCCK